MRSRSHRTERRLQTLLKNISGVADVSAMFWKQNRGFGGGDRTLMLAGHMDEISL
ncbi:MAG: hypothetical protein ACLUKN_05460 [Bacilli bacterium]